MAKKQKKGGAGAVSGDDRCPDCGGIGGRHNQVRETRRVPNPESTGNYMNKVVWTKCPRAK